MSINELSWLQEKEDNKKENTQQYFLLKQLDIFLHPRPNFGNQEILQTNLNGLFFPYKVLSSHETGWVFSFVVKTR